MIFVFEQCPQEKCVGWIYRYLNDCVCSTRDGVSFGFGIISVLSWGIAEVPQIITNFKQKSTEGVSILFLMTWVIGDIFNLAGCFFEPATLPTQMYMALLYTITTLVLVAQTIYYDHLAKTRKSKGSMINEPLLLEKQRPPAVVAKPVTILVPSQPMSTNNEPAKLYFKSARSLASSHTPTAGSYLLGSGGRGASYLTTRLHADVPSNSKSATSVITARIPAVASGVLLVGGFSLHSRISKYDTTVGSYDGFIVSTGRKLLQEHQPHSALGEVFGWCMAAIYMGGRLPQIWHNIQRRSVEGLNPFMFVFAVVGNATYLGSILVRSTEWERVKPNMPWLVDAAVCVFLDFFIISQYIWYFNKTKNADEENGEKSLS